MLNDELWSKLKKILLQEAIYNKRNLRMTVEGMLYRMRVGCPWRDLPKAFGCWNSIYKRFNAWSLSSKWLRIFKALVIDPDWEWEFIDGSYVKAHQHSAGAADREPQAIGKSRAGNTTKIHLAVSSHVSKIRKYFPGKSADKALYGINLQAVSIVRHPESEKSLHK